MDHASLFRRPYARLTEAIKKAACVETQAAKVNEAGPEFPRFKKRIISQPLVGNFLKNFFEGCVL